MTNVLLSIVFVLAAAAPAQQPVPAATQFMSALNAGNVSAAVATCTSPAAIIDEIPPHAWQGSNACGAWARDFAKFLSAQHLSKPHVTLGTPLHVEVDGPTAYVVFPSTFWYAQNGKNMSESALWTVALRMTGNRWKIAAWTWSHR